MFSNFLEDIEYFIRLANDIKNLKILLFNLPGINFFLGIEISGQAYTFYHADAIYNNDYNAMIVDLLLQELIENKRIDPKAETFRFIGSGFGANILLYFRNYFSVRILF